MRGYFVFGGIALVVWFLSLDEKPIQSGAENVVDLTKSESAATARGFPSVTGKNSLLEQEKASMFVSGSRVNVRSGPGVSNGILGQMNFGDEVKLISQSGGWREIETKFGTGWMSARYLSTETPQRRQPIPAPRQRTIAVPTSREIQTARQAIIRQSISSYQGSCPCPYNRDRAGRRCGGRSAWSKPGGRSPICYDSDISDARLNTYFARKR